VTHDHQLLATQNNLTAKLGMQLQMCLLPLFFKETYLALAFIAQHHIVLLFLYFKRRFNWQIAPTELKKHVKSKQPSRQFSC